ncbi:hypothetical protein BGZ82_010155 [Podila clonocystis]|nr:hypothetical protein BGZ82_010155 [Podila clonocystis]
MQCNDDIIIHYDPYASWTFSYSSTVPNVHSGSVLGPLRRRECQTRQQQIRKGTVRRIGIASKPEDRFQARAIAGNGFRANSANNSAVSSGNHSPNIEGRHYGALGLPPRPASEIYQTSSSTFSPNIMGMEPSSSSWTSIPSSPPRRMTSPNLLDVSSTPSSSSYDLPARTRSRIESASQRLAQGSSKSFMMVSQAMGFGSNASASSSQSSSTSPIASATNGDNFSPTISAPTTCMPLNSHLSVAQMGGGGRRMSTPSISSPKLSFESSMDPSSCSVSGSSLQRPASSLSQSSSSARSWNTADASSNLTSSDMNGYYNTTPTSSRKAKHQGSCRMSYDPHNSTDIVSDRVPMIISEREYCVEGFDKVFAATWLSPDNVLMGTKCHNILMLNVHTRRMMPMGRMQDCLFERPDQILPRLAFLAAEQEESNLFSKIQGLNMNIPSSSFDNNYNSTHSNSNRASSSTSPIIPAPSSPLAGLNGIASSLERGLRYFSGPTRRSSFPSLMAQASAQSQSQSSSLSRLPGGTVRANNTNSPRPNNPLPNGTNTTVPMITTPIMGNTIASPSTSAGVRSMSINPSRTLLAIGSGDPYQVTIYSLPEFEPVGMMYGHADLVFALTWVSDTVLVSGSRDGSTRVWSTESHVLASLPAVSGEVEVRVPVLTRAEDKTKVRDLAFNKNTGQLMTLTTEGYVKLWDRESYIQILS